MTARTLIIDHVGQQSQLNSNRTSSGLRRFDSLAQTSNEVWFLGGMDPTQLNDGTSGLQAGSRERELLFSCLVKPLSASQSNIEFLVNALPRFLQQLQPVSVEVYSLDKVGVELLRVVRSHCTGVKIHVVLDDAQLACPLNGVFINIDGVRCSAPSPKACAYCLPASTPAEVFYRSQYVRSHLGLIDQVQVTESPQVEQLIQWISPDFSGQIHQHKEARPTPTTGLQGQGVACFASSNDVAGLRVLKRAVAISREQHSVSFACVDVFPTDPSSDWTESQVDALEDHGLQVQLKWAPHYFDRYMAHYGWVVLLGTPSAQSIQCVEQARACGLQVIADESYPEADIRYAPHSAASLAQALAKIGGKK